MIACAEEEHLKIDYIKQLRYIYRVEKEHYIRRIRFAMFSCICFLFIYNEVKINKELPQ